MVLSFVLFCISCSASMKSSTVCMGTFLLATLLSIVNWQVVNAGLEHTCNEETIRQGPAQGAHCGVEIPNILQLLCAPAGYNERMSDRQRRNLVPTSRAVGRRGNGLRDIIISKRQAKSYLTKRDRNWTGIVCECCYNKCILEELLDYCKDPSHFKSQQLRS
uniref:Insulin-like peptide n=1 Tax=Sepia latimanus TaxID=3248881 RepID=A0A6B9RMK7_SEPLA|nr:insulin-like peptide [Sepia latimanus]